MQERDETSVSALSVSPSDDRLDQAGCDQTPLSRAPLFRPLRQRHNLSCYRAAYTLHPHLAPECEMARQLSKLLIGLMALTLLASCAQAAGLVVALYDGAKGPSGNLSATKFVVTPSPITGIPAAFPGCTDLPSGFVPRSGFFDWNAAAGTDTCSYFVFYRLSKCAPAPSGNETGIPVTSTATLTIDNFASSPKWANASIAKSVGCAYNFDPCVKYPCSDPNAICSSRSLIVYNRNSNKSFDQWISRDCNTCKQGCYMIDGSCVCDPCSRLSCPAPGWCINNQGIATCKCPVDWVWNENSKQCDDVNVQRWLTALNGERTTRGKAPVVWNTTLEQDAKAWAANLNTTQCYKLFTGETIKLSASPGSKPRRSEDRAFDGYNNTQANAVGMWMNNVTNAQAQRIIHENTTQVGCGKAPCNLGAFFVCQLFPFTY